MFSGEISRCSSEFACSRRRKYENKNTYEIPVSLTSAGKDGAVVGRIVILTR